MWRKSPEYGLHLEDVAAITQDSANPDLMKLGLALRARGLSIKEQNQITARAFHLLTGGDDSFGCGIPTQRLYEERLLQTLATEDAIKAYLAEFSNRPNRLALVPRGEDAERVDQALSTWIQATRQAVLEKAGLPVPVVDFSLGGQNKGALLKDSFDLAFRQVEEDRAKALAAGERMAQSVKMVAPLLARLFRGIQGKRGDDYRLGAGQAAVGEIKHQLLGQEILCKTFDKLL